MKRFFILYSHVLQYVHGYECSRTENVFGTISGKCSFLARHTKATYTYKNAEDGTRIYEGNFTYSCITNPKLYLKVTGRFHDDCKEGLWTYIDKSTSETKTLKINFKEGYRNGIYEYTYTTRVR